MTNLTANQFIRNIAIIAHVDHGKTTLVDAMFQQSGLFRPNQAVDERIMDSMDLERERGITIAAKNCSLIWQGVKINILDTPGHADFSGEVERALSMVNGAVLLVDASEGPLPQTRFVLKKTLEKGLKVIVAINKIDRKDARPEQVLDEIYDLFIDLDADDEQINFPVLYTIGRQGIAQRSITHTSHNLVPLFEAILQEIPAPTYNPDASFQMLVSDLGYSDYLGRLAIGRVFNGSTTYHQPMVCLTHNQKVLPFKINRLQVYDGVKLKETETVEAGDIAVISGVEEVSIGDTICAREAIHPLTRIYVDEPTISMMFTINTSPLNGKEGKILQSGKIRDRLIKETLKNVALRFEETHHREQFIMKGRGEFQMAILIETMRREGFELAVGCPQVIYREQNGQTMEPIETLFIDCGESFIGIVTEKIALKKGQMIKLVNNCSGRVRAEFSVPSRALIGYRDEFLTDTKGTGIMNTLFSGYEPYRGDFPLRYTGSIVSDRQGTAVAYALFHLEPRGRLFIKPGEPVYEGMIIGEHSKETDLNVNPCKEKKLTNIRASNKDESLACTPVQALTLEKAINFIRNDEMVEVTPKSIRMHKSIFSAQKRHQHRR